MANKRINPGVARLLSSGLPFEGRTDGELIEQFLNHREEAAFVALVKRHGPMA